MHKFKLRSKLIMSVIFVVGIVSIGFGIYGYLNNSHQLEEEIAFQEKMLKSRSQLMLPNFIWNFETEKVEQNIASEMENIYFDAIAVEVDGEFTYSMVNTETSQNSKATKSTFSDKSLSGTIKLQYKEDSSINDVGLLHYRVNSNVINDRLSSILITEIVKIILLVGVIILSLSIVIQKIILEPLENLISSVSDVASGEGDLTKRIKLRSNDEFGELSSNFNIFIEKLHTIVSASVHCTEKIVATSLKLNEQLQGSNLNINSQMKDTDSIAAAINEMETSFQQVSDYTNSASDSSRTANQTGKETQAKVENSMTQMEQLAKEISSSNRVISELQGNVGEIGSVLDVITNIAEQTNLLALNAAIEAARAGEQGRGFAVVADEVRTLASRTQQSTVEIQNMIQRLSEGTKKAVDTINTSTHRSEDAMGKAGETRTAIERITHSLDEIEEINFQVATAFNEQKSTTTDINQRIQNIVTSCEMTQANISESNDLSKQLSTLVKDIKSSMNQFKI